MTEEPDLSWFGAERIDTDARTLGVYVTLLIVQFRVRYSTDIPVLYREVGALESRLKPYLSIFLNDKENELDEAVAAGRAFLNAFVLHTESADYEEVLDSIELDYYETFRDVYLRHVNRNELTVKLAAESDALLLTKRFLGDVVSNKFSKGKITTAGSTILLMPFGELLAFYGLSQEETRRFFEILKRAGIMFLDILPAPVLDQAFINGLL